MENKPRAIVLLSGGLDSATTLAIAKAEDFDCYALTFAYGQRHSVELRAASATALAIGVAEHKTVSLDLRAFGGSALLSPLATRSFSPLRSRMRRCAARRTSTSA